MLYFEDNKNRNVLALFFTCLALVECVFFGFAVEELYSFLYPIILDFLCVFIIACLFYFLDFSRKMNAVFIFLGSFITALFIELCFLYFDQGTENGFYGIPSPLFIKPFLLRFLFISLCIISNGLSKLKLEGKKAQYILPVIIYVIYNFIFKNVLLSIFSVLFFVIAYFFINHLGGENYRLNRKQIITLFVLYFICMVLFFAYKEGVLLTQEVCSFFNLIIIFVGIILSIRKTRFGLYLIEFISLLMAISYLFVFIEDHNLYFINLFGIIPLSIIGLGAFFINNRLDRSNQ